LCIGAAQKGLLMVPGDCFGFPDRIRLGLGADPAAFAPAMRVLSEVL
jgi:hypothetical protein